MFKNKKSFSSSPASIKVVGIGGAGGHIITRMAQKEGIKNAEFIVINTDAQDLEHALARKKIFIGKTLTKGLGAGMNPELGKQAAEENRAEISEALQGADIVFVTAGLGGGTGSLGSSVVADIAKENGILTVAVVTKPFSFEGAQRAKIAQEALAQLKTKVDTLIVVPNDRIFNIINKDTSLMRAFEFVDDILKNAVQAITDLIVFPGIINLDFADIKAIMKDAGSAVIGIGIAAGQERAASAANLAISSPLLETSIEGAKGVLFSVSGGRDLKMNEIQNIAKIISESVDPGAKIIFGAYHDKKLPLKHLKATIIATGFNHLNVSTKSASLFSSFSKEPMADFSESIDSVGKESETEKTVKEEKAEIPSFLRRKKYR